MRPTESGQLRGDSFQSSKHISKCRGGIVLVVYQGLDDGVEETAAEVVCAVNVDRIDGSRAAHLLLDERDLAELLLLLLEPGLGCLAESCSIAFELVDAVGELGTRR